MSVLSELQFVDLYIGENYCDIKGLDGAAYSRVSAPDYLLDHILEIRKRCREIYQAQEEPEFSLIVDDDLYRVTTINDVTNNDVFILRRSSATIRPLTSLGLNPHLMKFLLDKDTKGTILIAGEMGAGKTSTAASIMSARLKQHGGIAVAIEDPPETKLNGLHDEGRCIQVRASRKNGGYKEQITRAMRSGADMILIGEVRDDDAASLVLQAGINGHFVVSTLHAGSIPQAIERLQTFALPRHKNANEILADGIAAVIWQYLEQVGQGSDQAAVRRLRVQSLILPASDGARQRIRKGQINQLSYDVDEQSLRVVWATNLP
jgi:twitching motility protein PilT